MPKPFDEQLMLSSTSGRCKLGGTVRRQEAAAEQARKLKLSQPIPLAMSTTGAVFGTDVETGKDYLVPMKKLQHMLVAGVAGAGKSVFLHQIVWQLVQSPDIERLVLIDLKGGVEFERYHDSGKVQVIWEFADVVTVIDGLMQLMIRRQDEMRLKRWQNWPGGRVVVVIDEYAEIQSDIDAADGREEKAIAKRLAGNLVSISRRARALGIVLVCALQKPTTDAMDSALRNNLSCRVCLRTATSALAASMLDGLDDLPISPTQLPTGRFIYYDASRGITRYMQGQIAPGVDLGSVS